MMSHLAVQIPSVIRVSCPLSGEEGQIALME